MSKSTRRQFILRSATQAARLGLVLNGKLITLPSFLLTEPAGPNDRVNLGFIGFGIRGNILLEAARKRRQTWWKSAIATRGTSNAQRSTEEDRDEFRPVQEAARPERHPCSRCGGTRSLA